MWEYLKALPPILSFTILLIFILAVVVISFKGKAVVKWGKNLVGLGDGKVDSSSDEDDSTPKPPTMPPPATVTLKPQKRACGDCILIIIGEREKYELNMKRLTNRVLKTQMNFVEQKLVDMQTLFVTAFMEQMHLMNGKSSEDHYEVQYKLFYGLLKDSLMMVKDELRRSFKENGFFELSEGDFSTYVKDKTHNTISIMSQHLRNLYPSRGVIISVEQIIDVIEKNTPTLHEYLRAVFVNAKQVVLDSEKEITALQGQFSKWVDGFVN